METAIIKIGNSKGLRLSKTVLNAYNIRDKVEMILEKEHIIIKPIDQPRKGWENAFKGMHDYKDDEFLLNGVFEDENFDEWN